MTKYTALVIALSAASIFARHVHALPQHEHEHLEPRQLGAVPVAVPVPVAPVVAGAGAVTAVAAGVTSVRLPTSVPAVAVPSVPAVAVPSVPAAAVPAVPVAAVPSVPVAVPSVPAVGAVPSVPVAVPSVPAVGAVPSVPVAVPSVPAVGAVPSVPVAVPSVPAVGAVPSVPVAVPSVPNAAALSSAAAAAAVISSANAAAAAALNSVKPAVPAVSTPAVPSLPAALPTGIAALPGVPSAAVPSLPAAVPSVAVPGTGGLPSTSGVASAADIGTLASEIDACLTKIPSEVIQIIAAVQASVGKVSAQIAALGNIVSGISSLPTAGVPSLPVATPAVSVPNVSLPTTPTLPSVNLGSVLPPVALPTTPTLPSVILGSVPVALPTTPTVPSVNLGSVLPTTIVPTAINAVASSLQSSIFVSQNPNLCPPPNGLGPMVPCASIPVTSLVSTSTSHAQALITNEMTLTTVTDFLMASSPVSIPTSTPYVFNANARDNLAAYYGSTSATSSIGLADLCSTNVDIVILAFLYDFTSANGYPSIDFGPLCSGMTVAQSSIAPGLKNCSSLASQITACQQLGKKVLLSLGGYLANSSFTSDLEARNFAVTLWNLFGAGAGIPDLRPFGSDVIIDGFDLDNEDGSTAHWDAFTSAMRALFDGDTTKRYYLSAAPQCPFPDASIPMYALQRADFVWVQFYNNPSCNLDSSGFQSSYSTWAKALKNTSLATTPRLYIGAPAFSGAGSGYVDGSILASRVSLGRELFQSNIGGIMLWDGSEALLNVDQNNNTYLQYAKWAMQY